MVLPVGHTNNVKSAVFSPDGKRVLTSSSDNTVKIFDALSAKELMVLPINFTIEVNSAVFSPNGELILTCDNNGFVRIFNANSGDIIKSFKAHDGAINSVVLSSNCQLILTASIDRTAKIWSYENQELIKTLQGHQNDVNQAIFNKKANLVLTSSKDRRAILWDINSDTKKIFIGHNCAVNTAEFNVEEDKIITSSCDQTCIIWDINNTNKLKQFKLINEDFKSDLYWNRYSSKFLSSSDDIVVFTGGDNHSCFFEINSGKKLFHFDGRITDFKNDDKYLLTVNNEKVYLYNKTGVLKNKKIIKGYTEHLYLGSFFKNSNFYFFNDGKTLDLSNAKLCSIKRDENKLETYIPSPNGKTYVVYSNLDSLANIYSFDTGELLFTIKGPKVPQKLYSSFPNDSISNIFFNDIKYSSLGKNVISALSDSSISIYAIDSGRMIWNIKMKENVHELNNSYSLNNDSLLAIQFRDEVKVYNIYSEKIVFNYKYENFSFGIRSIEFSPCSNFLLINYDKSCAIYELSTSSKISEWDNDFIQNADSKYSPDGKYILTWAYWEDKVVLKDIKTGESIFLGSGPEYFQIEIINFSPNGNELLLVNSAQTLVVDIPTGDVVRRINHGPRSVYSPDGKIIVTDGKEDKIILWDMVTGDGIYECINLENNNWLVKLPNSPYYMCSKDASKMLHYVTPSLKVIGFEQLDPVYNRPDIVLDSIGKYFGGADNELVANYRESWEKRIDRLGLDKERLGKGEIAVPNAEIVGADDIAYENKEGKIEIKVSANDSKYPLRRFNVYVNEVPFYGSAGISIAHLKKQVWDTTVSVPLSVGENKIQVSVMNELGLENFKYPTYVNYMPNKDIVAKTHYIGIGVNEFKEPGHKLNYCVKDVRDLAKAFSVENKNIDTLLFTDKQVTKENILALKDYLNKTGVNEKVIISCSSHGLLDDSLNFYLAMHDVDFDNPKARGLKYEELESLLDGIPARQKLLLLDACNSGENDKTEVLKKELQQKENNMDSTQVLAARGVIIKLEEENKSNFKKMNELFVNVRNNTGSVIISAAGGQESALEAIKVDGKTIENGAFTYSILECLKRNEGKELKVNTLKQYAEKRVEEITGGKQKPTSRQETMEVDWGVK